MADYNKELEEHYNAKIIKESIICETGAVEYVLETDNGEEIIHIVDNEGNEYGEDYYQIISRYLD